MTIPRLSTRSKTGPGSRFKSHQLRQSLARRTWGRRQPRPAESPLSRFEDFILFLGRRVDHANVSTDGPLRFEKIELGMRQTLVAVNGLGGLAYLWNGFERALPSQLGLRVVDLPGHGDEPAAADYSYGAVVEDVVRRSADLPPFSLVGWSVGAAVGWLLA